MCKYVYTQYNYTPGTLCAVDELHCERNAVVSAWHKRRVKLIKFTGSVSFFYNFFAFIS
jgi:hypothetical protein